MPQLSVALVLHNSGASLEECLRSLRTAVGTGWAEVIAVDNASVDDSVDILRRELPAAQVIRAPQNLGFAAGANAALAGAVGRYWLLLNPDVSVPAEGLHTLVKWMDAHPGVAVASPQIRSLDGTVETPGRTFPSIARTVFEMSRMHRLLPPQTRGRILRGPYLPSGDQLDADWVPGTAMIVRPAAASGVGLLCEEFFMYGEDLEWCWRLRRAGWAVGVCSSTTFVHHESSSAVRTFGHEEKRRRVAAGTHQACRRMRGSVYARAFASITAASLSLEARAPGRTSGYRAVARGDARIWWELARAR